MGNISKPHSAELDGRCWLVSWLPCKITVTTKGLTFPRRQESEKKQLIEMKITSTNCWVRITWKSERKQTSPEKGNWRILRGNWWFSVRANTPITKGNWHFQVASDYCLFLFYRFLFVGEWSSPPRMRLSGGQFPNFYVDFSDIRWGHGFKYVEVLDLFGSLCHASENSCNLHCFLFKLVYTQLINEHFIL